MFNKTTYKTNNSNSRTSRGRSRRIYYDQKAVRRKKKLQSSIVKEARQVYI